MNNSRTGLTPEERALAGVLAAHPTPSPSAELDAAILAAARAATAGAASADRVDNAVAAAPLAEAAPSPMLQPRARKRPRWPVVTGIAASLMLALGVMWQLRPALQTAADTTAPVAAAPIESSPRSATVWGEQQVAQSSPPAPPAVTDAGTAVVSASVAALPEQSEPEDEFEDVDGELADAQTQAPEAHGLASADEAAAIAESSQRSAMAEVSTTSSRASAARSRDDAGREASASAELPPAIAAAPPAAVVSEPAPQRIATRPPTAKAADDTVRSAGVAAAPMPRQVDGYSRAELDADPPARTDEASVRRAWLQRVRDLKARERMDEARASLQEFVRRYPDSPVPDDLKPMLPPPEPADAP